MKKLLLTTALILLCFFKSYSQDPLYMPFLLNASLSSHKLFWEESGYTYYDSNNDEFIIAYENSTSSITYFIDFTKGWKTVEEVKIIYRYAEDYYRYLGYCTDNYLKINEDEGNIFLTLDFKNEVIFSIESLPEGLYYTVTMKHSK